MARAITLRAEVPVGARLACRGEDSAVRRCTQVGTVVTRSSSRPRLCSSVALRRVRADAASAPVGLALEEVMAWGAL